MALGYPQALIYDASNRVVSSTDPNNKGIAYQQLWSNSSSWEVVAGRMTAWIIKRGLACHSAPNLGDVLNSENFPTFLPMYYLHNAPSK